MAISKLEAEKEGFLSLIKAHERIIHKVCRVYVWNESERDDLFQEILYQIWRSWSSFRGQSKPSTFIYKIALNTACTQYKKNISQQNDIALYQSETGLTHDESGDDQLQRLYWAIGQLNDVEKAVISLYLDNHSTEQIADFLGITASNAGVKIYRIKKKLKIIYHNEKE